MTKSRRVEKGAPRTPFKVDRDLLHQYLWRRSVDGYIEVRVRNLGALLDVTPTTISRALRDLREDGRLFKVKAGPSNVGTYEVADPAEWRPDDESTWANGKPRKVNGEPEKRRPAWE